MKIQVSSIIANPYRQIDKYPIDRAKVDALKTSISEKTFWDNILLRKVGNKYELAYGHHRWIALKELGIKEIDVPIRDISDADMVQIMAEENLNWSSAPAVMVQTIKVAKDFLDAELAKYDTWEEFSSGDFAISNYNLIDSEPTFRKLKGDGVGRKTVSGFLGGNWSGYRVRTALEVLADEKLDQEAVLMIPTMEQAKVFHDEVKRHKIPKQTQKRIAKKIVNEGIGKRDIPDLVAEHSLTPEKRKESKPLLLPMLDDYVISTCKIMTDLRCRFDRIKGQIANIQSSGLRKEFIQDGKELIETIKGVLTNEENEKTKRILSTNR